MIGEGLLQSRLVDEPWRPLVTKLGYALGFVIVTLGRQQLYTENTLTAVIPALEERSVAAFKNVLRLWSIVLAANLIGALAAAAFALTDAFRPEFRAAFVEIGTEAMQGGAWVHFLRGIPAGSLIALIIGGVLIVAGLNHAQTAGDR
jgi:formate/nitrite transporter FocA (FNT family)